MVLVESPSYLGALNAFKAYCPQFIEVPTDKNGMIMEELERILETTENVKMIYVIPDFQNPTGKTWSMERRTKFMELVNKLANCNVKSEILEEQYIIQLCSGFTNMNFAFKEDSDYEDYMPIIKWDK